MRVLAVLVSMVILSACQTPMQAGSQCVVGEGFMDDQSTFTWRSDTAIDVDDNTGYVGPIAVDALEQAVITELAQKGFGFVPRDQDNNVNEPQRDFEVALTLRTRRELVSYETNGTICQKVDCWERIDPSAFTRMDIRTIGFLAADVYYEGEAIWRGWVETTLYPKDRDQVDEIVTRAIPRLFESFPP
ncbi:MAG: DUF4136 domain-containing protein [Gammaproteobacteria bacterium]|nr:DUF4136 domain-containing protein [Gammaproteobacteria bacterium]